MNIFHFMAIAVIWVACYMSDNLFIAMICTFLIVGSINECECDDEEDEEDDFEIDEEDWDKIDKADDERPANQTTLSIGPTFPDYTPNDKHLHYLEEPDSIGVFSYDRRNMAWVKVTDMPYAEGQAPSAVATVIQEQ